MTRYELLLFLHVATAIVWDRPPISRNLGLSEPGKEGE
jgi:hypothetical protein